MLLNLPERDLEKIETLVKGGEFATKTELIRFAIKQFLYNEERMKKFEKLAKELQKQGLKKERIEEEIEEAKEQTRKLIKKYPSKIV